VADKVAKILVVDDEEVLTTLISDYFEYHESGIHPIITNDPHQVFPLLEEHKDIQLILSDFKMPEINGLELLLRVKAKYPKMLFALMTGYGTQELKKVGLQRGAFRYIEKPIDLVELSEIIREELKAQESGFGGLVEAVQLPDIIQLMGISRRNATLNIVADQGKGKIIFQDGEVVHAVTGKYQGEEAFYEIMKWSGGRFALADPPIRRKRTINTSWQGLLLDSARILDETKAGVKDQLEESEKEIADFDADEDDINFDIFEPESGKPVPVQDEMEVEAEGKIADDSEIAAAASAVSFDELHDDLIGIIHQKALNKYILTWPGGENRIAFNALPLSKLTVNLRRHFFFNFHLHWTKLINKKEVPFDFTNDQIAKALQNLLLTLRKNWNISRDEYKEMLDEALRFELTRYVDPAKALVLYIHKYTQGKADSIKSFLSIMIENKLIGSQYETLSEDIGLIGVSYIRIAKLEDFVWAIFDAQSEDDVFAEFKWSFGQILNLLDEESESIEADLVAKMLETRGLDKMYENVRDAINNGKENFSLEEINDMFESLQKQSKKSKKMIKQ